MREPSAGGAIGGRLAVVGLFAALAGGLFWSPAAVAAEPAPDVVTVSRNTGGTPETNAGTVSGTVDTGLPIGSSWT
ncbi:hypothetical protein [Cryptosporangium sp. NPDC048952]|uniref:hypothetical protein n=1 Tax=Cryptosporangium sp. NPDC048952 TaxID=3363961 RepID=UPI00371BF4BE